MKNTVLITGDVVALAVVTLIGFATHGELSPGFLGRMAASFIPLCLGWFLLASSLDLFNDATARARAELWRPAFVMLFAGPFGTLVRSMLLGDEVVPSFAVVFTLTAALALTIWRVLYLVLQARRSP